MRPSHLAALSGCAMGGAARLNPSFSLGGLDGSAISGHASTPGKVIGPSFAAEEVADVIEAVLADGSVLSRWTPLVKDNVGYDIPGLLAGSEGVVHGYGHGQAGRAETDTNQVKVRIEI